MPARFDDDERRLQLLLGVQREDSGEFGMHRLDRCGQDSQVDHAGTGCLNENKGTATKLIWRGHG